MSSQKSKISSIYYRLLLLLILLITFLYILLPEAAIVFVSPPARTVNQGQSFELDISIDPMGKVISGAQLDIAFNQSLLKVNSVSEGNLFTQNGASTYFNQGTINNTAGTVKNIFGVILGPGNISTNGTFIRLNLTAIGQSGISDLTLSNTLISDPDALAVPLITKNGSLTINSVPVMPNIGNKNIYKGQNLTFSVLSTDINGDPLQYSASNLPPGAAFNAATATFMWTPNQSGVYPNVRFEVSDGMAVDSKEITITVDNITEIVVMPSSKTVRSGQDFTLNVSIDPKGTGIAGAQLNIAVNQSIIRINNIIEGNLFKQGGASTVFNSGVLDNSQGTVANIYAAIIGSSNITTQGTFISINATAIGASGISGFDLSNIMITNQLGNSVVYYLVNGTIKVNDPPVLAPINNKTVNEGQLLSFNLAAMDVNGDILSYSASNLPSGATFNQTTGAFIWTPTFIQARIYPAVHFEVTDGVLMVSENITVTVINVNRAPTFTLTPSNGSVFNETDIIYVSVNAMDLDNDTLNYSIKIDSTQVSISSSYDWMTNYDSAGNHEINISVTDGTELVSKTISVYINNVPQLYDVNENGFVDIGDIVLIGQHFNEATTSPYPRYDVNRDGIVNIVDLVIAGQHFGEVS
jgi:hypothetical protein